MLPKAHLKKSDRIAYIMKYGGSDLPASNIFEDILNKNSTVLNFPGIVRDDDYKIYSQVLQFVRKNCLFFGYTEKFFFSSSLTRKTNVALDEYITIPTDDIYEYTLDEVYKMFNIRGSESLVENVKEWRRTGSVKAFHIPVPIELKAYRDVPPEVAFPVNFVNSGLQIIPIPFLFKWKDVADIPANRDSFRIFPEVCPPYPFIDHKSTYPLTLLDYVQVLKYEKQVFVDFGIASGYEKY